jgi:hypothetical protein
LEQVAETEGLDVTFEGFVPEATQYLSQASVAFVSGYLSMLEAMAYRRPVFSVYHTPVKADYLQMVPNAAQIFAVADGPEHLASQLAALLSGQYDPSQQIVQAYDFSASQTWARLADTYGRLWGGSLPTSQAIP